MQFVALGTQFVALGVQFVALGTQFVALGVQLVASDAQISKLLRSNCVSLKLPKCRQSFNSGGINRYIPIAVGL